MCRWDGRYDEWWEAIDDGKDKTERCRYVELGGNWPSDEMGYAMECPYDACGAHSRSVDNEEGGKTVVLYEVLRQDLVLAMALFDEAEYVTKYREIKILFAGKPRHVEVMRVELELYRVTKYDYVKRGGTSDTDMFSWLQYSRRCKDYQHDNMRLIEPSVSFANAERDFKEYSKSGGNMMKRVLSRVAFMSTAKEMPYCPGTQSYRMYYEDKRRSRLYGEVAFSARENMVKSVRYRAAAGTHLFGQPSLCVGDIAELVGYLSNEEGDEKEIRNRR